MARVAIMGGPKSGRVINMGKGWGEPDWNIPPYFRVPLSLPVDPDRPRGRRYFTIVDYSFYRKLADGTLIYKHPGYVVGSL